MKALTIMFIVIIVISMILIYNIGWRAMLVSDLAFGIAGLSVIHGVNNSFTEAHFAIFVLCAFLALVLAIAA